MRACLALSLLAVLGCGKDAPAVGKTKATPEASAPSKADDSGIPPYAPPAALAPPVAAGVNDKPGTIPDEVGKHLTTIGKWSKAHFVELGKYPIGSSDLLPDTDCCAMPGQRCPGGALGGPFDDLIFEIEGPHQFRYSYRSLDGASYVVRAVGDEDCDGTKTMFELWGYTVGGQPAFQVKKWF
jgi:hypothetical protein